MIGTRSEQFSAPHEFQVPARSSAERLRRTSDGTRFATTTTVSRRRLMAIRFSWISTVRASRSVHYQRSWVFSGLTPLRYWRAPSA
jgi:hypothetical protein